jgi:Kef-type K+ transport system membrane component KefB
MMTSLPIQEPVFVFTIVMAVIFLSPYVMRLIKLPEIVGIIFFGIILGPNGLNILERDTGILLFGTVGILFIMFYSGLELDMKDFRKKKLKSIAFGFLTFIFPITAGFLAGYLILRFNLITAILFGSLFSSHTLLAYPTVGKLGVKDDEAVVVTVGGTLITNSVSMLILAIIASYKSGGGSGEWYDAPAIFICFSALVMMFIPKIARWFFRTAQSDSYTQYIFIITILFLVASLGKMIGIEPIIGAFLAGLAVNTLIPANSILMNRIGFVGNTLFIPFFLIYVGMLTDVRLLFSDWRIIMVAILMFVVAVPTKYFAAWLTQKAFKYSKAQKELIFGLSNAQAANTLAVILVGIHLEIFEQFLLDGAILLMLATCIISAIYTEKAARSIASKNDSAQNDEKMESKTDEKILLLLSNPATVTKLVDLAVMMKEPKNKNPIYPLTLIVDARNTQEEIAKKQKLLQQAQTHASGTNQLTHLITRVDVNVASGVSLASKEFSITHTILGWNASPTSGTKIFGTVTDHILGVTYNTIIAAKAVNDWYAIKRLVLFVSPNAHFEPEFSSTIMPIFRLAVSLKTTVTLHGSKLQLDKIMEICKENNLNLNIIFEERNGSGAALKFAKTNLRENDFSVIISGRKSTVSFSEEHEKIPGIINYKFPKDNFLLVHPPRREDKSYRRVSY